MKKTLTIFLFVCMLMCAGCFDQNTDIINNSFYSHNITQTNEMVGEVFAFNLSVLKLDALSNVALANNIVLELNKLKEDLTEEFSKKLGLASEETQKKYNGKVALLVSDEQNILSLKINFENKEVWNFFSSSKKFEPQFENSLFTIKRIDSNSIFGAVTNSSGEEKIIGQYIKEQVFSIINSTFLKNAKYKSSFNYITSTRRRHSTADAVMGYAGLYYHQWDTSNEIPQIKIWYTYANIVSWYVLALILTAIIVSIFLLISHLINKKKELETKEINKEVFLKEFFENDENQ